MYLKSRKVCQNILKYIKIQTKIRLKYNFDKNDLVNLNKGAVRIHSNGRKLLKSDHVQKISDQNF